MRSISHLVASACAFAFAATVASSAGAADSTHGALYIQGSPIGVAGITYQTSDYCRQGPTTVACGGTFWSNAYRLDFELGYHFSKRYDGFVLAGRQVFYFNTDYADGHVEGATQLRLGYDIPIPIKQFELNIDPYGVVGVGYGFSNQNAAFTFAGGVEGKFFIVKGFYAFARPIELGAWLPGGMVWNIGAGVGYAF